MRILTHGSRMPTEAESRMAEESNRRLEPLVQELDRADSSLKTAEVEVRIEGRGTDRPLEVPVSVLKLLSTVLEEMAQGHAVMLTPVREELTTQEAADLLNVSRPFVCKLLDEGVIPHRKVGRHRRALRSDFLAYKRQATAAREAVLEELTAQAQELGMGY